MIGNYLTILEDSLRRKLLVLEKIQEYNRKQQEIFHKEQPELEQFDHYIEEKGTLIEELQKLDEGFETLYTRVAGELKDHKEQYADQIHSLQELITRVTEMGVSVSAQEERNKRLVEEYFARGRSSVRQGRRSSKAAFDYYRNMNNTSLVMPQFMDKKK